MTTDEFNSTSKEYLLLGAKETYRNASSHYLFAEQASSLGHFGIANSLLILSVEECIKSIILTAGYFNIEVPFEIKPFFSDHKTKHGQAAELQPLLNELWKIKDLLIAIFKNRESPAKLLIELGLTWVLVSIGLKNMQLEDFKAWWGKANYQKNCGLYVGFENGKWILPSEISKEDYERTLIITKPFIECLTIVNELRSDDYKLLSS